MDRLSELPDYVIFHIFWFLPMREVVRTTILSRRWKDLWTTTPFLYFDDFVEQFDTRDELRIFVHRVLSRWDGVKILKFKVELDYEESIHMDVDLWLRFAKKYGVEELYLHMVIEDRESWHSNDDDIHWLPQFLCSCSSLKVLSIENCYFRFKGNVQWNHLKSLTIRRGYGVTDEVINQILCGSPQLEVLILSLVESDENLYIRSTSLKELSMNRHLHDADDDSSTYTAELRIWTPNLKTLEIKGIPYRKCLLMNVSSLTHVTLEYSNLHRYDRTYCDYFPGIDDFLSSNHFFGDLFGQILPNIQHVENVKLLPCCFKVLRAMIEGCMNLSSPNVKSIQFRFHCTFVGMIEIFPLSKKLFIEVGERVKSYCGEAYSLWASRHFYREFELHIPMSFMLQLRIVEVTLVEGDILFPFLESLLKNASKLEKIVFRVKGSQNCLLHASQMLLKMPRSSRTAVFSFCEY